MIITNKLIKCLNPHQYVVDNFNTKYPNYNDSLSNLLALEDISYDDKTWLICKVVDIKTLQQWSIECAEYVVDNFNTKYPNDSRVSDCIEMTKRYLEGKCTLDELEAAWSAVRSAGWAAAAESTEAAETAAAWSAAAAAWAAAAESAEATAWAAVQSAEESAEELAEEQKDINLSLLIALL